MCHKWVAGNFRVGSSRCDKVGTGVISSRCDKVGTGVIVIGSMIYRRF